MYHKIRITVASLVVMALVLSSSVGTLSYFTDTDSATNSFLVGNASTELAIYSDTAGEHVFNASDYTLVDNISIPYYLQATNNGNIPVYQRFRIVIPITLAGEITLALPTINDGCVVETTYTCNGDDYIVTYNPSVDVEGTPTYAEYYIVSSNELTVGSQTQTWPITSIEIGNMSSVSGHENLLVCADDSDNNCVLGIRTYSDAIQTAGFNDAIEAFTNVAETY